MHHSTETVLIKIINDIRFNSDSGKISVLVLLDLSAAFDTVDHNILLERLENWVGLSGMALKWLRSYLEGRGYYVSIGEHKSKWTSMTCGVPQGSILAPLLFSLSGVVVPGEVGILLVLIYTPNYFFTARERMNDLYHKEWRVKLVFHT